MQKKAKALGLEWIQDIVPNHIAYAPESTIVSDVMKFGLSSNYYKFLDVDWNFPSQEVKGKILAPFLEESLEGCLKRGLITLIYDNDFKIKYASIEFPVKISSYSKILSRSNYKFPSNFQEIYNSNEEIRLNIENILKKYNENPNLLRNLLSEQIYALADWRTTFKEINYRRFFDINDLLGIKIEEPNAFETTHQLILQLLSKYKLSGLRVDHIDGLNNPNRYLKKLRSKAPEAYIIIEKILQYNEELPKYWPIQGTTGYDFLNMLNGIFVRESNESQLTSLYREITGVKEPFSNILIGSKKSIIQKYFAGDVGNLARTFYEVLKDKQYGKKLTFNSIREAIAELLLAFDIYRTYISPNNFEDKIRFKQFLQVAKSRNPKLSMELDALNSLIDDSPSYPEVLQAVMRLQQYTGPIVAKGLEDTAFYRYNRLLSLNEVGGFPSKFGLSIDEFYNFLNSRQQNWPLSLNATSTHDTKRGEDARARINFLSEIPTLFGTFVKRWSILNQSKKVMFKGKQVPNGNEECYFYQSIIGSFPFNISELPAFISRTTALMIKALREAKQNSLWISPDTQYEEYVNTFVTQTLTISDENFFLKEFMPFQEKVAFFGFHNSLSQTLVKITSPGIPDFYQGAELWDFSFVDPDNRKTVDFEVRVKYLREIQSLKSNKIQGLVENYKDGRVKLFLINKALRFRKEKKELFQNGNFLPLKVKGLYSDSVIAFCRKKEKDFSMTVAPRFLVDMMGMQYPIMEDIWRDTFICIPFNMPRKWIQVFSGETLILQKLGDEEGFYLKDLLQPLPVALLSGEASI